jgi:hypothetical protein
MSGALIGGPLDGVTVWIEHDSTSVLILKSKTSGSLYRYNLSPTGRWTFEGVVTREEVDGWARSKS